MATEVYTTQIVTLQDDEEVLLRPLPIAKLRKFMRVWAKHIEDVTKELEGQEEGLEMTNADLTDKQLTAFIKMCSFGLESQLKGDRTEKQFLEYLEEVLDEPTIIKILEVTGNFKQAGGDDTPNLTPEPTPVPVGTN